MNKIIVGMMLLVASSFAYAEESIVVKNAWVRLMPPSETTSAAYMEIENSTDENVVLESASSPAVGVVELHEMSHQNGMMKMGMVHDLIVPAHGKFVFDEQRYHLMLINLKESLKKDSLIPIVLHFKTGSDVSVNAVVTESKE